MNTEHEYKDVKRISQRSDGLWLLDGKLLTDTELDKLIAITDFRWILIMNPSFNKDSKNNINAERN